MSAPMEEEVRLVKSGGPVTPEGKARSARNAVKHGLRASAVVIPGEAVEDWIAHRDGVRATIAPTNALEESIVERIAEITWRMRRVASTEADGITKHALLFGSDDGVAQIPRESLQRYETHLSRQLALAIATLERVRLLSNPFLEDERERNSDTRDRGGTHDATQRVLFRERGHVHRR